MKRSRTIRLTIVLVLAVVVIGGFWMFRIVTATRPDKQGLPNDVQRIPKLPVVAAKVGQEPTERPIGPDDDDVNTRDEPTPPAQHTLPDDDPETDRKQEDKPIAAGMPDEMVTDKGFFFDKGKYVPPPYRITCAYEGVLINGICIIGAPRVPEANRRTVPDTDPGVFQWTPKLKAKGMTGSGFLRNAMDRRRFWRERHGWDESIDRLVEYLRKQPLVARVWREGNNVIYFAHSGDRKRIGFSRGSPPDEEEIEQCLKREATKLHKRLEGGLALFAADALTSVSPRTLTEICRVLVSAEELETRIQRLETYFLPRDAETIARTFEDTPHLRKRMRTLGVE